MQVGHDFEGFWDFNFYQKKEKNSPINKAVWEQENKQKNSRKNKRSIEKKLGEVWGSKEKKERNQFALRNMKKEGEVINHFLDETAPINFRSLL